MIGSTFCPPMSQGYLYPGVSTVSIATCLKYNLDKHPIGSLIMPESNMRREMIGLSAS